MLRPQDGLANVIGAVLRRHSASRAPGARSGRGQEQEDAAVEHGKLSLVQHRDKDIALRAVGHEVTDRHLARENERDRADEESDQQQRAADQFEDAGNADQRSDRDVVEHRHVRNAEE
jgi:hypothetical protein